MGKSRLEAFSDGVLAIVLTIMVLELKVPHEPELRALLPLCPTFFAYVLSFIYVGIYWNNHHHLMHTLRRVTGAVMWANLHLLFWLSLFPFVTAWVGDHPSEATPAACYGMVLLAAALAWLILQHAIIRAGGSLEHALGSDRKGKISPLLYASGIAASFVQPWFAELLYAVVAALWIIPDRRIEREVASEHERAEP